MRVTEALFECFPKLKSFHLMQHLMCHEISGLLTALQRANMLSLLFRMTVLDANQMMQFCDTLRHLRSLTLLYLGGSLTCPAGDRLVMEQMYSCRSVQYSALASKYIREDIAERLMIAIVDHPTITSWNAIGSKDIGYMGLEMIGLHLGHISDVELKRAIDRVSRALVEAARVNAGLRSVLVRLPKTIQPELDFYVM